MDGGLCAIHFPSGYSPDALSPNGRDRFDNIY